MNENEVIRIGRSTAVLFGMLGVTGFGLLFTPAFYTFVRSLGRKARNTTVSSENMARPSSMTRLAGK
jgi:hypothetical protein